MLKYDKTHREKGLTEIRARKVWNEYNLIILGQIY